MERLPELSGLSHADKDQLIRFLWESLGELREELSELRAAVQRLETENAALRAQLAKDSTNSSKPPASDGLRKTCSLRQPSERPVGGVPGHPGFTLPRSETPDFLVDHFPRSTAKPAGLRWRRGTVNPAKCPAFLRPSWRSPSIGAGKPAVDADTSSREPSPMRFRLPCSTAPFQGTGGLPHPDQMLPAKRTDELLEAWCGVHPSTGTVVNLIREAGRRLGPLAGIRPGGTTRASSDFASRPTFFAMFCALTR